jgi:hypothetical protein
MDLVLAFHANMARPQKLDRRILTHAIDGYFTPKAVQHCRKRYSPLMEAALYPKAPDRS